MTKLIQEVVDSRDALREELVEVYVRVRRLPKKELPLPKEATRVPTSFTVLESLLAFAKEKADKGDQEARDTLGNKELEEELASDYLPGAPASGASAADVDVEEAESLELGVPAPGASLPPSQVPVPGEDDDGDNMDVEQEVSAPDLVVPAGKKRVETFFQPKAKLEPRAAASQT
eukprot:916857-Amphidinium_carterae.1